MKSKTKSLNGLTCHIVDDPQEGNPPRAIVVFCHGFGAPGTDLVPIGQMLLQQPKLSGAVQFLFPEAPLSLDDLGLFGGRAWWPIDMRRLQTSVALGTFRELCHDCPPELPKAREMLLGLIRDWSAQTGVPISRFVLGGFSQGSMLATDVALHLEENPAGLVILSGTIQNEPVWKDRLKQHKTLRIFQSHGTHDPILPFVAAGWLRDMLNSGGADVEFLQFNGGHEIPMNVLERLGVFLREVAGDGRNAK